MGAPRVAIEVDASSQRTQDDRGLAGWRRLEAHLQSGESDLGRFRPIVSRPMAGGAKRVRAEGAREVPEPLPLPACVDVHTLQGDRPGFQVTGKEAPQTRPNRDPVDHEERRRITGRADYDRSHHEAERGIDASHPLDAGAGEAGGESGHGAFVEGAPGGC